MKKVGSRIVKVGDRSQVKLRGESKGVDKGDNIGELLGEDMLPWVRVMEEEFEFKANRSRVGCHVCELGLLRAASLRPTRHGCAFYPIPRASIIASGKRLHSAEELDPARFIDVLNS
jgi:hypothetical protein